MDTQLERHRNPELYALKGRILWNVNYISIRLFFKNGTEVEKEQP